MTNCVIKQETEADIAAIHAVNAAAFETTAEADLVDSLRARAADVISLVAERDGEIVGHILFSPVSLASSPELKIMGLAPMAVAPTHQRSGIGSALVRAGLEQCKRQGVAAVVVLGHPAYYPRFGFVPSVRYGIDSEYDVPQDVFMLVELVPGALQGASGTVRYHAAFRDL
jgi:putative acetyltransferase